MKYSFFKHLDSEKELKISHVTNQMVAKDTQNVIVKSKYFQNYMAKKSKRYRSAFTTEQINYLESEFKKFPYIGSGSRKETANKLGISEKAVKIWFQNRRMKEKKESVNKACDIEGVRKDVAVFTNESLNNGCDWQSNNDDRYRPIKPANSNETKRSVKPFVQTTSANSTVSCELKHSSPKPTHEPETVVRVPKNKCSNSVLIPLTRNNSTSNTVPVALKKCEYKTHEGSFAAPKQKKVCIKSSKNQKKSFAIYSQSLKSHINQDVPHDLSSRSLNKLCTHQLHQYPVNAIPGASYMPLNMQNCYTSSALPPGNLVWKPVSILPALPVPQVSQGSMGIPQNTAGIQLVNNHVKNGCSCNCHGSLVHSFNQANARTHPQYIIAIPFSNQPKSMRLIPGEANLNKMRLNKCNYFLNLTT